MKEKQKKSLSDSAYNLLKEKIVNMSGGSYLSARQFARENGMSYTPAREAFLRMQREGSLRLVPNVGFFVETLDITDLIQIFQVRECIEVFVLDKVFDHITKDHIALMRELNAQQKNALASGDVYKYLQLDEKFHEITFKIYDNKHLINFYKNVREQYMICSSKVANKLSNDAFEEHSEYFASLEAGDKDKAIRELKKHIYQAKERMTEGYINVINGVY